MLDTQDACDRWFLSLLRLEDTITQLALPHEEALLARIEARLLAASIVFGMTGKAHPTACQILKSLVATLSDRTAHYPPETSKARLRADLAPLVTNLTLLS